MKKLTALLLVLSFLRIGFAYADTETGANSEVFTGLGVAAEELNLVLVAFEGADGEAGPAGTAGADGIDGIDGQDGVNGVNGINGVDGAPGATGPAGPAGATGPAGPAGAPGATGATGATGPAGPAGSGGGGGGNLNLGQGIISAVSCENDGKIFIDLDPEFDPTGFTFGAIKIGDPTPINGNSDGDIKATCAGSTITFFFKMKPSIPSRANYSANDVITCTYGPLPAAGSWPTSTWQFNLNSANTTCVVSRNSTVIRLNQIYTADHLPEIGFDIGR